MLKWWQGPEFKGGEMSTAVFFQVDLRNYSAWVKAEKEKNIEIAFKQIIELSEDITNALHVFNFHKVKWEGDGGVFAAYVGDKEHPKHICTIADQVMSIFESWKGEKQVDLCMTATLITLKTHFDHGVWWGPEYNEFIKFERDFAQPGAFVITSALRTRLTGDEDIENFPEAHEVPLPNGNVVVCYKYKRFAPETRVLPNTFGMWLDKHIKSGELPNSKVLGNSIFQIDDCTILRTAPRESGFKRVILEKHPQMSTADFFQDDYHRIAWQEKFRYQTDRRAEGTSMQVAHFVTELEDDCHPRLSYREVPYAEASAFHIFQKEHPETREDYRNIALQVIGAGTNIPNILSTAIIVIVGTQAEPLLVIANRMPRGAHGYSNNRWAVSIGEQFAPTKVTRGNRQIPADVSFEMSVERGLREELTDDAKIPDKISIQVFGIEDLFNNFVVMAVADLRPWDFKTLAKLWHTAIDREEHVAIAAIPANKDVLWQCINSRTLPNEIWQSARESGNVEFHGLLDLVTDAHQWQATSAARLALAAWYCENYEK